MSRATLFTDAPTGREIILVSSAVDPPLGITYDPRRADLPLSWHSECSHCIGGRQKDLTIYIKREIQLLLSIKGTWPNASFTVPSNNQPHYLFCWPEGERLRARISTLEGLSLDVFTDTPRLRFVGRLRDFQSPILHRCLKLVLSGRPATPNEISACLEPLIRRQTIPDASRPLPDRRNRCCSIQWSKVIEDLLSSNRPAASPPPERKTSLAQSLP